MTKGFKSRKMRRVYVKTPGGKTVLHHRMRKPAKAHCAGCRKVLAGVPREFPSKMANMPKTAKRPERKYGGNLCTACARKLLKSKARTEGLQ